MFVSSSYSGGRGLHTRVVFETSFVPPPFNPRQSYVNERPRRVKRQSPPSPLGVPPKYKHSCFVYRRREPSSLGRPAVSPQYFGIGMSGSVTWTSSVTSSQMSPVKPGPGAFCRKGHFNARGGRTRVCFVKDLEQRYGIPGTLEKPSGHLL